MPETHESNEPRQVGKPRAPQWVKPAERLLVEQNSILKRVGRNLDRDAENRICTPNDQDNHHDRGDGHDLNRLFAGLVNSPSTLPPEVKGNENAEECRKSVLRKRAKRAAKIAGNVFNESGEILAGNDRTDGTGQNIVEQQS